MAMNFQIIIYDGFEEMDVFGVYEALRMADFDVRLVSLEEQQKVTAIYGTDVIPHATFDRKNRPDVFIVPGGGWLARAPKGAWAEAERGRILAELQWLQSAGSFLVSVCTGSLLLGKARLLDGRPATTNAGAIEDLRDTGAKVVHARVVDDGSIVTAAGITASLDLGIWLVERFSGIDKAIEVSRRLEFEPRGTVWKRQPV
jgi:transcriptional regulator GlxA family with amidase domain